MNQTNSQQSSPVNDLLNGLIQLSQNTNSVGGMTNMAANTGIQLGQKTGDALGPLMGEVAKKTLTKYLTGHAENLLATDPNGPQILAGHVEQAQPNGAGGTPQTQPGAMPQPQAQPNQAPPQAPQQSVMPQQQPSQNTNPLQILGSLLGQVRDMTTTPEHRLMNAQAKLVGQQTQNVTPEGALALKTAEGKAPLTTEQIAQYQGTIYGKQLEAASKQVEDSTKALDNLNQQMKVISDFTPIYQKLAPVEHNKIMQGYQALAQKLSNKRSMYQSKLESLSQNAPPAPKGGSGSSQPDSIVGTNIGGYKIVGVK